MAEGVDISEGERARELAEGAQIGGAVLHRRLAGDDYATLWLTEPLDDELGPCCARLVPESVFVTEDGPERLVSEMAFWLDLHGDHIVHLYHCGREQDHCFALMRYMRGRSVQRQPDAEHNLAQSPRSFATSLAGALRNIHAAIGAHGNLKPTNVFSTAEGAVIGDFQLPVRLDEYDEGAGAIAGHIAHAYRAPEQLDDPRAFDTRSDIYSYGLVLLHALTGIEPDADGRVPEGLKPEWPDGLLPLAERCLALDPDDRFVDAEELVEFLADLGQAPLRHVTPAADQPASAPASGRNGSEFTSVGDLIAEEQAELANEVGLERAHELVEQGMLNEAVETLESIDVDSEEMTDLLDEIERRQRRADELTKEAMRLAEMGQPEVALDNVEQAAHLWTGSTTIMALKADLAAAAAQYHRASAMKDFPDVLSRNMQAGEFSAGRGLIDRMLREGEITDEVAQAVGAFKQARAQTAFLQTVRAAKRLYVLGDEERSQRRWLDASLWLAPGRDRQRLRRIAAAAGRGRLALSQEEMTHMQDQRVPNSTIALPLPDIASDLAERVAEERSVPEPDEDWRHAVTVAGLVVALIVLTILVLAYLF